MVNILLANGARLLMEGSSLYDLLKIGLKDAARSQYTRSTSISKTRAFGMKGSIGHAIATGLRRHQLQSTLN
jgi:hypothetical protein